MTPAEQWLNLQNQIDELKKQQEIIGREILSVSNPGDKFETPLGKLNVQQNNTLDDASLRSKISSPLYTRISVRKISAALLAAEIKRGKIPVEDVEASKKPGKPYLKRA